MAFHQEMVSGHLSLDLDPDDIEQSLLKQYLFRKIKYGEIPDLVTLTKLTHETILENLEHMISLTVDPTRSDYAVFSGIQVHGPEKVNYIWPGLAYTIVAGQRHDLPLGTSSWVRPKF